MGQSSQIGAYWGSVQWGLFKSALKRHTKACTHISCCVGLQEVNNLSGDLYGKVKKCPSNGFNIAGSRLHPSLRGCADAALISLSFHFLPLSPPLLRPPWWPLFNPDPGSALHILCLNYCLQGPIFLLSYSSICNPFHRMRICWLFSEVVFLLLQAYRRSHLSWSACD